MELESIIKQEEFDRLNEAINLAREFEYRLDKIKEQVFEMANGNKEPERLVKFEDIVNIYKYEVTQELSRSHFIGEKNTLTIEANPLWYAKITAILQLMILADYYNEGWQPDWSNDNEIKYTAFINKDKIGLDEWSVFNYGNIVFKSEQLLQTAIENNREIFTTALK